MRGWQIYPREVGGKRTSITYPAYLSAVENGKENFTIGVLESLAAGLRLIFRA